MPNSSNFKQSQGVFSSGLGYGGTIQMNGGQFVQYNQVQSVHICYEADDGYKHLQAHVATSAFDSAQYVDAPKCHPNTRKAVLDEIMNWVVLSVTRVQWVLWLSGAAGAGKSAIIRSIVDLCVHRNIPIARFFFFRTGSTRNNTRSLVATLVHQLLQSLPDLEPIIIPRIRSDSLIFTKSLYTQFEFLIFGPLRELKRICLHPHTLVLCFDGVDECDDQDDQASLIRIVAKFVASNSFPVVALFASRNEDQISTVFRSTELSNITLKLPLDNNYLPDDDIRLFLDDSFDDMRHTHPFAHLLDEKWPSEHEVQEIVEKSSGQFIYASVVVKFCAMIGLHPEQQLKIVRGLRPRGKLSPFAELDALYRHIFSQARDLESTSLILAWTLLTNSTYLHECTEFLEIQDVDVYVALASLQSIVDCTRDGHIRFIHASLPDFLFDSERSQEYYIDRSTWSTRFSVMAFKFVILNGNRDYNPADMYLNAAEASPELRDHVLAYDLHNLNYISITVYLNGVRKLDFGDGPGGTIYQDLLNSTVRYMSKNYTDQELVF